MPAGRCWVVGLGRARRRSREGGLDAFGRSAQEGWRKYMYLTVIQKFLRQAPAVDVHIVTQEAN